LAVTSTGSVSGRVDILLGNGDGTFGSTLIWSAGQGTVSLAIGDFDKDGTLDFVIADQNLNGVVIRKGNGTGSVYPGHLFYLTGNGADFVVVGDLNGDGAPDLVVTNNGDDNVSVLLNQGPTQHKTAPLRTDLIPTLLGN
jgi:hypothetical protein